MTDLTPEARALLDAARNADELDQGRRARMKAAVLGAVGVTGAASAAQAAVASGGGTAAAGGGAATAAAAGGGLGLVGKIAAAAVLLGTTAGGGWLALREAPAEETVLRVAAPVPDAAVEAIAVAVAEEEEEEVLAPEPDAAVAVSEPAAPPQRRRRAKRRPADVAAELELLREAGAALRAGAPEAAIERLEDHRKRFPRGALVQEREALRVDALCAGGDAARGRRLAEDFLARWPRSPHRGRVERACRVMDPGDAGHSPL